MLLAVNDQDRRGFTAKLSDFGLSRFIKEKMTHLNTKTFGTVTHMPAELLDGGE